MPLPVTFLARLGTVTAGAGISDAAIIGGHNIPILHDGTTAWAPRHAGLQFFYFFAHCTLVWAWHHDTEILLMVLMIAIRWVKGRMRWIVTIQHNKPTIQLSAFLAARSWIYLCPRVDSLYCLSEKGMERRKTNQLWVWLLRSIKLLWSVSLQTSVLNISGAKLQVL